jgi:transaldolase
MIKLKQNIDFSLWCDFVERDFIENDFKILLNKQLIQGATSNPDIFKNAITNSNAYIQQISMLQANEPKKIYEEIAIADIKKVASLLKPLFEQNNDNGFVSLEVDPTLCDDTEATIAEAKRLFRQINTENLMIKIPATTAGIKAMKSLTLLGININATLVFSPIQAKQCAKVLNEGIKQSGKDTKAVISVFVSRFDRILDNILINFKLEPYKIGIVNATKCYYEIERFNNKNIRTLFASTGVKNDQIKPSYYIDNLIFPHTVNTAPLNTIKSWEENGIHTQSKILDENKCDEYFNVLKEKDININEIYDKLLKDGLSAFKVSFEKILNKVKL